MIRLVFLYNQNYSRCLLSVQFEQELLLAEAAILSMIIFGQCRVKTWLMFHRHYFLPHDPVLMLGTLHNFIVEEYKPKWGTVFTAHERFLHFVFLLPLHAQPPFIKKLHNTNEWATALWHLFFFVKTHQTNVPSHLARPHEGDTRHTTLTNWEEYLKSANQIAYSFIFDLIVCFCISLFLRVPEDRHSSSTPSQVDFPPRSVYQQIRPTRTNGNKDYLGNKQSIQINNSVSVSLCLSLTSPCMWQVDMELKQTSPTFSFELSKKSQSSYFQLSMFSSWLQKYYLCIQIQQ